MSPSPSPRKYHLHSTVPSVPVSPGITSAVMFAAFLVDCVVWYKAGKINATIPNQLPDHHPQGAASNRTPEHAADVPEAQPLRQAP